MENYDYYLEWKNGGDCFKEISVYKRHIEKSESYEKKRKTITTTDKLVMTFHLDRNWQRVAEGEEQVYLILYEKNKIYIGHTDDPQTRKAEHKDRLKNAQVLLIIPGEKEHNLRNMENLAMKETEVLTKKNSVNLESDNKVKVKPKSPTKNFKDNLEPCFKSFFPLLFSFVTRHLPSLPTREGNKISAPPLPQSSILVPTAGWSWIKLKNFNPPDYELKSLIESQSKSKHRKKVKLLKNSCFEFTPKQHNYSQEKTKQSMKRIAAKYSKLREEQKITLDPSTWNGEAQPQTIIKIKVLEDIEFPSLNALICFLRYTASVGKKWKDS